MKVLLIDVNCKSSSTGKIVYDLYTSINKNGDEAAVCYGRGNKIKEPNIYKFGLDAETYLHALLTRLTGLTGCFSLFSTLRLIRFIKKFRPDVVHIHELHAYFVNIKRLLDFLKKSNIKTVMTLHCEFAYTGKCGHSVECEKWKTECGDCPHLKDYPSVLFFDNTKRMYNQKKEAFRNFKNLVVVAPSKWLAERAKQSFLNSYRVEVIHNGIDTDVFSLKDTQNLREMHGIEEGEKVVLALAPNLMSDNKGGKYVFELADKMRDEKVKFILIGVDEEISEHNKNIIVLPRIYDKKKLAQYYSLADVFVICSLRENFPTTCLEAQCCGLSVCGFDAGGTKETIVFDPNNSCVPYGDVDALLGVLNCRLNNTPKKSTIEKAAFEKYAIEHMYNEYYKLYH